MTYHGQFTDADLLDTMSWAILSQPARIMKLACLFLKREDNIKCYHRNWRGPTVSNVRPFVKSYYTPPRGQGKATIEMVLKAIEYQRKLRHKRQTNRPYVPETADALNTSYTLQRRRNAVAARHYTIKSTDWDEKAILKCDISCAAIGVVNGIQLMVDKGSGYGRTKTYPRIFMLEKATGKVKVVVLEPGDLSPTSITAALSYIAPKGAVQSMFGGDVMTLMFDDECYLWRGRKTPWENVRKVYRGKAKAHKTKGRPKRKTE